jgi:hypothetical protein
MILYLDNVQKYKVSANQLSYSLTLSSGQHNITVNAWDSSGAVFKNTAIATASGTGTAPVSVAVSPSSATLAPGKTQQFTATVLNTTNTAVTWTVDGLYNGNTTVGMISNTGLYTAPETNGTHTIVATSQADPTKSDSAIVTVTSTATGCTAKLAPPSITICSPTPGSTVANPVKLSAVGSSNYAITKFLVYSNNTLKYSTTVSSINTSLTLPTGKNNIVFQFYSNGAWTKASDGITVSTGVAISVSPTPASVAPANTVQFTAKVTGTTNTTATWAVDGTPGGNSSIGTISSTGLYTAPSTLGTHTITATSVADTTKSAHATVTVANPPPGIVPILTYHGDASRTGSNTSETLLNTANVHSSTFGKKYVFPVDGQIYAQPLYVPNLTIGGTTRNVVYVATENDSVYAFDADGRQTTPLWKVTLGTPLAASDSLGIKPSIGITSTPVIDHSTNTIYVVAVNTSGGFKFQLHALSLTTGAEKFGGPVQVTGSVTGSGADSSSDKITLENGCFQRSGLALANSKVYLSFAHCGHGWILSYDAATLLADGIFNTTPDGAGGTIWMSGGAPAVDASGNIYVITGTNFGDYQPGYNNAFLKMTPGLSLADYFMPANTQTLINNDADLGSGGVVLLPDNSSSHPHELIGGGKDGRIFVIDRDAMGEFQSTDHVVQVVQEGTQQYNNMHCTPVYWNNNVYVHSASDVVRRYSWSASTGLISTSPVSKGTIVFGGHGATPVISSNGSSDGILWEINSTAYSTGGPAVLHAYDANDLTKELYNSTQAGSRDTAGPAIKFTPPIVTDGKVFVPTAKELDVYGLL